MHLPLFFFLFLPIVIHLMHIFFEVFVKHIFLLNIYPSNLCQALNHHFKSLPSVVVFQMVGRMNLLLVAQLSTWGFTKILRVRVSVQVRLPNY